MNNLFIMHTQYNLILSAAVMSRSKEDNNTLILWAEFALGEQMQNALNKIFDHVIVVNDSYVPNLNPFKETAFIRKCLKKVKSIKDTRFDCVYLSQERVFDLVVCEMVKQNNHNIVCIDIEEDAYYSLNNSLNIKNEKYKPNLRRRIRRWLYHLLLVDFRYSDRDYAYCYGMSGVIDEVDLLFPWLARPELADKKRNEITKEELLNGIESIYSNIVTEYPQADKYMVMFFDLMDRYKNKEFVKQIVLYVAEQCRVQGRVLLMKYHPREIEKFSELGDFFEINKLIPAEKVLYDLIGNDVSVFVNATASSFVAAKLGYSVNSICMLEMPENKAMHQAMKQMGINCISEINQIKC